MYLLECVEREDIDWFPLTKSFWNENNIKIEEKLQKNIQALLEALKDSFEHYFPAAQEKVLDDFKWVLNVFNVNKKPPSLNSAQYEVLIDLTSHRKLKIAFQTKVYRSFGCIYKVNSKSCLRKQNKYCCLSQVYMSVKLDSPPI